MKIIRYEDSLGQAHIGVLESADAVFRIDGDIYGDFSISDERADIAKRLAPIAPSAIMCIGLNYRKHAEEGALAPPEYPIVFFKGLNTVQNPEDPIVLPSVLRSNEVDYEAELAVVIGKRCKNVTPDKALEYVLGYTCANDVSARDWQGKWGGGQWSRGKTFDTFAPLGPCLVLSDEISDPNMLRIRSIINGNVMQDWNTSDMIFNVPSLIAFLSGSTTLYPGTVILTGTPHGVGGAQKPPRWLRPGDVVTIEIEKIGSLANPVVEEALTTSSGGYRWR